MATTGSDEKSAVVHETQVPEWEHAGVGTHRTTSDGEENGRSTKTSHLATAFKVKLDSTFPPHRQYARLSRKAFLWALLGASVALLVLIIALPAGLTHQSHDHDLPLPSNANTFTGDLTYFGTGLGACGETDTSSDKIVSLSHILFDAAGSSTDAGGNSNDNPLCNLMLRAQRYDEEYGAMRSVDLRVVDRCVGCAVDDLDTTESAFEELAPLASGRVDVTWAWLQPVATGT